MSFQDKIVIITGAAQGIGLACAERFAKAGAHVALVDRDADKGAEAAASIPQAQFFAADLSDAAEIRRVEAEITQKMGAAQVLVNNAAIIHTADFLELEIEDFDRVLAVNLRGALLMSQSVAKRMVAEGIKGAIVNMSSVNAVMAIPNQIPYNVSKGGLNQLTKVTSLALAPHGIRVNGIGPGSIMTDMLKVVMNDEAARQKILSRTPLGRCGEPEEIANLAHFLASDEASYITGQTIYADGGRLGLNYTVPVAE